MVSKLIFCHLPSRRILLFGQLLSAFSWNCVMAGECDGGHSEFGTVRENSMMGTLIANLSFSADPSANHVKLKLFGKDSEWFYLEGITLRLNSSSNRILDREVHDSVLTATVKCYEHETIKAEHRIVVAVLNENDNKPEFIQSSIQPVNLSELTAVNAVAFTVQAEDADGDVLTYIIDETSPDADYFRVDLPDSGRVILNKSLDYESKTLLQLVLNAVESNTNERYSTTATIIINVTDGDDQYPQFQPCILLSANHSSRICANPVYTANITENDQDIVLDFFPGPIHAVDGDRGLRTTLTYTILSGADNGRFVIDSHSGEVRLTRPVENRLLTPTLRLRVMAAQVDDPLKYTVATVLVRVLAENRYPPQFNRSAYRGFVREGTTPASLVMTYGNALLTLKAVDQDFSNGFNPRLHYSLKSENNSSRLFYITQEGLLIARSSQLYLKHKYFLEVVATDLESGDIIHASLQVDVLQKGQPVPHGPLGAGPSDGIETVGRTEGLAGMGLILLAITLFILVRCIRMRRKRRDPAIRASVAENKHPNVVNHWRPMAQVDESFFHDDGFVSSTSTLVKQLIYPKTEEPLTTSGNLPSITFRMPLMEPRSPAPRPNKGPANRGKTVSFGDFVTVQKWETMAGRVETTEDKASIQTEKEICNDYEKVNEDHIKVKNIDSDTAKDECITGPKAGQQRITEMFNGRLQGDYETTSTSMDEKADKTSPVRVCTNPEDLTNQYITHLEMQRSPKRPVSEKEREKNDPLKKDTTTQSFTLEDATQAEKSNISSPKYSLPESSVEKIEAAGIQDGRNQITFKDTPKQNIIAQDGGMNMSQLSPTNLNSTLMMIDTITDQAQTISNMFYVNEDIKTSLDDISSEVKQEFLHLDASDHDLHSRDSPFQQMIQSDMKDK